MVFALFFIFVGGACNPSLSEEGKIGWVAYDAGHAQAKVENKKIFLHFYTNW